MQANSNYTQTITPSAMYRARDCARFFSIGLSTWWHWCKTGKAKRGTKLSQKVTCWDGAYLLELKQQLIAEAQGREG